MATTREGDDQSVTKFDAEAEIDSLESMAKVRKEEAKDFRDDGDIKSAIQTLEQAIIVLDRSPLSNRLLDTDAPSAPQKKLAFQLADCLGMLGGNYRRHDQFPQALAAFTRGRIIEESEKLAVPSSYNLVNAITLPLEIDPHALSQQEAALRRAIEAIQRQVASAERRADRWAWADLGECQLLLGDLVGAEVSYLRVRELGNTDTFASVAAILRRLQKSLEPIPEASEALKKGVEWMEP
jgi:tetratricopeptide (TPR) repeat protein